MTCTHVAIDHMPSRRSDEDSICKSRALICEMTRTGRQAGRQEGRKDGETAVRHAFNIPDVYAYIYPRFISERWIKSRGCPPAVSDRWSGSSSESRIMPSSTCRIVQLVCAGREVCMRSKSEARSRVEGRGREREIGNRPDAAQFTSRLRDWLSYGLGCIWRGYLPSPPTRQRSPWRSKSGESSRRWLTGCLPDISRRSIQARKSFLFVFGGRGSGEENWILQFHIVSSELCFVICSEFLSWNVNGTWSLPPGERNRSSARPNVKYIRIYCIFRNVCVFGLLNSPRDTARCCIARENSRVNAIYTRFGGLIDLSNYMVNGKDSRGSYSCTCRQQRIVDGRV